ncbi:MAG: hypothetical protein ABIM50_13190 [Novosphingobium sp.]
MTTIAGSLLLASGAAMAQPMGNGPMGRDHAMDQRMDHAMNNGDRMHDGDMHRNGQMDNRVVHRDSRNMRHHGWDNHHRHCWTTWRHHHRVRTCGWR